MGLTEEEIRKITLQTISDLGENGSPEKVKEIVAKAVSQGEIMATLDGESKSTGRVILTSFGMNHPGIVSGVTQALSEANVDITDLSQKLMGDFYTMIMMLDISNSSKNLSELQTDLNKIGGELKIKVYLQHEDLFRFMHRV